VASKVRVVDNGYDRLMQTVQRMQQASITVGVHANEGQKTHAISRPAKTAKQAGPVSLIDVALWNEFGVGVPERPFLRGWFDATTAKNQETMMVLAQSALKGARTVDQALELAGARFVGELQQRIARGEGVAPNSPITIALKGSSVPLVDTGQLRAGLTFTVRIGS